MNMNAPADSIRYGRDVAMKVAKEICLALKPHCARLVVAGSMRRRKETVKDVEILYVGRTIVQQAPEDMFMRVTVNLADQEIAILEHKGFLERRRNVNGSQMWGEKNKLARHVASGIPIDLFATTDESWFNYLVCRTGPAELNTVIATRAQDMGWKWNPYGPGFSRQNGLGNEVHRVASEQEVFAFVALPYLEPWERTTERVAAL